MKSTTKQSHWWLTILSLVFLLAGLTACSSSEGGDNSSPEIPINDDDWETIPTSGGTIEKGDISIIFPSGTFSEETKVAVTEAKKGEFGGECEVSAFYQIMLPAKIDRQITVKMKPKEQSENVRFVAFSPGLRKSVGDEINHSLSLDASYSEGEYSVILPATNNDADDESSSLTLGLLKVPEGASESRTRFLEVIQGKVGNIEWYYDIGTWDYLNMSSANKTKWDNMKPRVNEYIADAIKKIHDLGFSISKDRKIPFVLINDTQRPDAYGYFVQSWNYDEWNTIELNMVKLFSGIDETSIKQTIIHELLHYFQSSYDPRSTSKKKVGGEENTLDEAASVWVEQFMNDGKLNGDFVCGFLPEFIKGLENVDDIYPNNHNKTLHPIKWKLRRNEIYDHHGYGMSTLLYYLTSPISEMTAFDIDKTKIIELFNIWKNDKRYAGSTFMTFRQWLRMHDAGGFLDNGDYDQFLIRLLDGKLVQHEKINPEGLYTKTSNITISSLTKKNVDESCLNLGCSIDKVIIGSYKDSEGNKSFKGTQFVVKQLSPDVQTFVFVESYNTKKFELIKGKTVLGDSLVIDGDYLDGLFGGEQKSYMWLVTTNHSGETKPYSASVELKKKDENVEPSVAQFPGNVYRVSVVVRPYWKEESLDEDGKVYRTEEKSGIFDINADTTHPDPNVTPSGKLNFTYSQSSIHVEGEFETATAWARHDTFSFDIVGIKNGFENSKVQNLTMTLHSLTDIPWEHTANANNIPYNPKPPQTGMIQYYGTVSDGVELGNVTKYIGKSYRYTFIENPDNDITVSIYYKRR